jgi:deoxyribonuclease V
MLPQINHPWDLSPKEARSLQLELAGRLVYSDDFSRPSLVAGVDVSYAKKTNLSYAGVIVFTYPELRVVEQKSAIQKTTFPYVPGLLTFREGPSILAACARLEYEPDLIIFDGQGQAHPKGFGIAAHMGLLLDRPSIGCAKKKLCGSYQEPGPEPGSTAPNIYKEKTVGMVVRTKEKVKPVFISSGHRISLSSSVDFILTTCRGYRLPEVIRQAHNFVNQLRQNDIGRR